jgi:AraC-like DNA-binding protein
MSRTVTFGNEEEGPFYIQHIHRSFERTQHIHDMYELYYLYEGERMYFIRDRSYLILPGDLVLINRRELLATSDSGNLGHARVVINFDDSFVAKSKEDAPFLLDGFTHASPVLRLDLPTRRLVEDILGKLIHEAKEPQLGQTFALRQYLTELLLFTARFVLLHPSTSPEHVSPLHQKISSIVRFINTHYPEPLRLEELAEQVGFGSLVQFGRVFRQMTKTTPLRYRQSAVT